MGVHVESESLNKEFVGEKFHIMFWRDEGLICNAFNLGGMVKKGGGEHHEFWWCNCISMEDLGAYTRSLDTYFL